MKPIAPPSLSRCRMPSFTVILAVMLLAGSPGVAKAQERPDTGVVARVASAMAPAALTRAAVVEVNRQLAPPSRPTLRGWKLVLATFILGAILFYASMFK